MLITLQYCGGFCHTLTWISHKCTCVPHPANHSRLPPHPIPLGCPSALALSTLFHALNLDQSSILHMVLYMFQCYALKSSHPHLLPQSPKFCSLYLCLFCHLTYWVIIIIFLNSTYVLASTLGLPGVASGLLRTLGFISEVRGSLVAQEVTVSVCSAWDLGSIPGSGRSPGEGNGNPFQYACLENPHGQRILVGYSP